MKEGDILYAVEERPCCDVVVFCPSQEDAVAQAKQADLSIGWRVSEWVAKNEDGVMRLRRGRVLAEVWTDTP